MFPRSLFGRENSIFINRLMDEMSWPTSRNGKVIHCIMPFKMSNLHYNWWEASRIFETTINPPLEVPFLRYGKIYKILFGQNPNKKQYEIIIENFLACMMHPQTLDGLNCESKCDNNGRKRSWGALLGSQHFGGRKVC
jgi:hypothetical protein